jgi:hypothetical protein
MMWYPNAVETTSLVEPGDSLLQALSDAATIFPGPNQPRSPPLDFDGQVECSRARDSRLALHSMWFLRLT